MKKRNCFEALEYLRTNDKVREEDIRQLYGREGVFMLSGLNSRIGNVQKEKNCKKISYETRSEIIDTMIKEIKSGQITVYKDYEKIALLFIIVISIILAILSVFLGSFLLIVIPPIWIIIILLLWIIKKI